MSRNWTTEQVEAIDAKRGSILVAAAAGAGKTAVLVERIIRAITKEDSQTDIDQLLVVTFTNAAAAEMRERIGMALSEKIQEHTLSQTLQKKLRRQLTLLNKASITTIHSFCLEIIRSNFNLLELDPSFGIGDETETTLLKYEALEEVFEEHYEEELCKEEFLKLVDCYGGKKEDRELQELVLELYHFTQSCVNPQEWLESSCQLFQVTEDFSMEETLWAKELLKSIRIMVADAIEGMEEAIRVIQVVEELEPYAQEFMDNLACLQGLYEASLVSWEQASLYCDISFGRLKTVKADLPEKDYVKKSRDEAKSVVKKIKDHYFAWSKEQIKVDFLTLSVHMNTLSELVMSFEKRYAEKKREKNIVDFSDLEHFCLRVLRSNDEVGIRYKEKFHEIFVDEYQDSNLVQEEILQYICRQEKNMFMVGDVKQSIYRFRQAKPELFMEKYLTYGQETTKPERLIKLYKNFRSHKNILDGTNFVFGSLMSQLVGEMEYGKEEELLFGSSPSDIPEEPIELHVIDMQDIDSEEELEAEQIDKMQTEARIIGDIIVDMVQNQGVKYEDIVILLRATSKWAGTFAEELQNKDIPVYTDAGSGYFQTIEVLTVLSLLHIIDNPLQDIPLLAVLRSPIVGLSADDLVNIHDYKEEDTFYEALQSYGIDKQEERVNQFLTKLRHWRECATYMAVDELIWMLYGETNYFSFVGALVGGIQRQANLRILFQRAKQFEGTNYKGLFNFLNFIGKMKERNGDFGSAKQLGDHENVVRIMSIHKSKGLEFPVVILAGTGKEFNLMDTRKKIILHQDMGFGPEYINSEKRIKYPSIAKIAIGEKIKNESLSEEMRILYVAMTRAKKKLIITGTVKNLQRSREKWSSQGIGSKGKRLSPNYIMKAKGYMDWLAPIFLNIEGCEALSSEFVLPIEGVDLPKAKAFIHIKNDAVISKEKQKIKRRSIVDVLGQDLEINPLIQDQINRNLSWEYQFKEATTMPAKRSVSEMKGIQQEEIHLKKPSFIKASKTMNAVEQGTYIHDCLEKIDLKNIDRLHTDRRILKFLDSPLGQRLCTATEIYREIPFAIELPCGEQDAFLLQGIIDCYFVEDGKVVLLDYKTGRMDERYEEQLKYYEMALEKAGLIVAEKHIVFLD